ncbi:MAG: hypothetical protein ABJI60_20130 [Kangiellaceae bacterium]
MTEQVKFKMTALRTWVESNSSELYWFLILLAIYPALRADLLFPHTWHAKLSSDFTLTSIDNPFGYWMLVFSLLVGLAAIGQKRWLGGSLATLSFIVISVMGSEFSQTWPLINTVYIVMAFVLFIYFVVVGSVRTISFFIFVVLLIVTQSIDSLIAWPQIIVFIVASMIGSLVAETIRQNIPLAKKLGRNSVLALSRRTFSLWWPMLILIAIGLWLSKRLTESAEAGLYAQDIVTPYCRLGVVEPNILKCPDGKAELREEQLIVPYGLKNKEPAECIVWPQYGVEVQTEAQPKSFLCPTDRNKGMVWELSRVGFFASLDLSVEKRFADKHHQAIRMINHARYKLNRKATNAGDAASTIFEVVPETTGMKTSKCGGLELSCHAANIVITGLNAAYVKARKNAKPKFVNKMKGMSVKTKKEIALYTEEAKTTISATLLEFEQLTRTSTKRVHTATNMVRQVLLLWLILIAIKSFLFVFARVIFDKSTDIDVDLLEQDGDASEGTVKSLQEINIPGSYPFNIYYKANYQPLGPAPRFNIPQWRSSLLSRLRFGAWNMSQVKMPIEEKDGLTFNAIEAEHLVNWELEEGEEVVFSYRHFVAMNENIQLRTVISLRVETLLLGRIVFHTAKCIGGPGRLILRTRGKPATAEQVRQSIPAARLVAWNRYAKFSVDSHLTKADMFLNGFNLKRSKGSTPDDPQGILIVEADARDGGILVGTLRFAKNFLLPI